MNRVIHADCRRALCDLIRQRVMFSAIVMDPPAALGFMGESWDGLGKRDLQHFMRVVLELSKEVTEPDAWAAIWAHPLTSHWTACGVEDAGWVIEHKIIHLNAEARPQKGAAFAPGHEEWILARKPGPMRPLKTDLWKQSTTGDRELRTVLVGDGFSKTVDALIGVRRSGAISNVRAGDADGRSTYGRFAGTNTAKAAAASAGGPSRYFPSWDDLLVLYAPRARHKHRALVPGGPETKHKTAKSEAAMLPIVDLVSGTGGPVFDPTCGSGATLAAAVDLGLECLGIDWLIEHAREASMRIGVEVEDWSRR